jgi:hypothetical protein
MAQISAYLFPGSLAMTAYSITGANTLTNDASYAFQDNLNFYNDEFNRTGIATETQVNYYIQVTTNINSLIHNYPAATIKAADGSTVQDDVWSFDGVTFTQASAGIDVSFNLPIFANKRVGLKDYFAHIMNNDAAERDVKWRYTGLGHDWTTYAEDSSGALLAQVFDLDILLGSNSNGVITATTSFYDYSGSGFEIEIPENIAFTQVISLDFSNYASKVQGANTATKDRLTISVDANSLNAVPEGDIKDKRNAVDALYNGQHIFSAWSVNFIAQDASGWTDGSYNTITNYARDKDWTVATHGFAAGERIVAGTPASFSLSILDMNGASVELIPLTNIYGVLRQSA